MLFSILHSTLSAQHGSAQAAAPFILPVASAKRRQRLETSNPDEAACYARYSCEEQNDTSIDDQVRECRTAAGRIQKRIPDELIYEDRAVSGTKSQRDGLGRMLEDARLGKIRTVFFYNLSRLARESVIGLPILKQLVYVCGVRVISVKEGIDSDNTGWEMIAALFSVHHEQYIRDLSDNVRKGQQGTVLSGFSVGDFRFGYRSVPSPNGETIRRGGEVKPRKIYEIDTVQAEWVRQIFHWFVIERRSRAWIVQQLNQQKVAKDHRSSTEKWTTQLVVSLLRSSKYTGLWPWGQNKNTRNPFTGKVDQKPRDEEEASQWLREFPELRIVSDEIFLKAQQILDRDAEKCSARRRENGKLTGSDGSHRTQLLTGLFVCPDCASLFYVCGSHGDYLGCSGNRDGLCKSNTVIPRRIAKRLILDKIGELMLQAPAWIDAAFEKFFEAWQKQNTENPGRKEQLQTQNRDTERRIERLIHILESNDEPDPGIRQRLRELRKERDTIGRELSALSDQDKRASVPPTRNYVVEELCRLNEVLQEDTPAANELLRNVLGGTISLELISEEGRKRKYWRGTFRIQSIQLSEAFVPLCTPAQATDHILNSPIVIDFRKPLLLKSQIEEAWKLLQTGLSFSEIGKRLKVGRSRVTGIMKQVARKYGDGCSVKELKARFQDHRPPSEPRYQPYVERAMAFFQKGLLYAQIADLLGTHRNMIQAAVKAGHEALGLQVPDGRTRRSSLEFKGRPRTSQPSDSTDLAAPIAPPEADAR